MTCSLCSIQATKNSASDQLVMRRPATLTWTGLVWAHTGPSKTSGDSGPRTRRAIQLLRPIGNSTPRHLTRSPAESPAVSSCAAPEAVAAASEFDAAWPPVERLETMARELIIGLEGLSLEALRRRKTTPAPDAAGRGIISRPERLRIADPVRQGR